MSMAIPMISIGIKSNATNRHAPLYAHVPAGRNSKRVIIAMPKAIFVVAEKISLSVVFFILGIFDVKVRIIWYSLAL